MHQKNLVEMKTGTKGKVKSIAGGINLMRKLEALGIRPGVEIKKVSTQFMRGPVIVRVANTEIAIGFGMAQRIMVEE